MNSFQYTIPTREEILQLLRTKNAPIDIGALAIALKVKPAEISSLTKRLDAMEKDRQIKRNAKDQYQLCDTSNFIVGRVSAHRDGFGFLIPDEPDQQDIFLSERELQRVFHGDRVQVRITGTDRRGRLEGAILEVLSRANTNIVGRLSKDTDGSWIVSPEDNRIAQDIIVTGALNGAKDGQVVNLSIIEQPSKYAKPTGKITEVLGDIDDPGMEIEIAVRKFSLPYIFSKAALKLADKLPSTVQASDIEDRVDLRDVPFITIDGEDARDFDDAVYCEPIDEGKQTHFRLLVAIADVSHYVTPNDALDADALLRSTSVYFPRRVIPMLPEKLSNGLCSLNPHVDRLTLVCDAVISPEGDITAYQFYPAVIHSAARMTYTDVAEILIDHHAAKTETQKKIIPQLINLNRVFHTLLKARAIRGAIDFDTTETYIVCDANGKIEKIIPRTRNDAHKIIEECMLAANVCAADLLQQHKHPGTYRIHAAPTKEKLTQVRTYLKQAGLFLGGGDTPSASDYASIIDKIRLRPDANLLQTMLLRSMQQAVYSPDNIGHFGLAYDAYAHFTSPIRRYPDLLTHRAIKAILAGKRYTPSGIDVTLLNSHTPASNKKQGPSNTPHKDNNKEPQKAKAQHSIWDALGSHCSANERRADEASRDVQAWLKCYFMKNKIGEEFTGIISGVTSFGIFVQLDALFIEGLVHVTDLGNDYFQYDEARHELRSERTGKRYQLTDRVTVEVVRVDIDSRKIDLRLAGVANDTAQPSAFPKISSFSKANATPKNKQDKHKTAPKKAGASRSAPKRAKSNTSKTTKRKK